MGVGTGKGVRIAIIDSGVEVGHEGLDGLELLDDFAIDASGPRYRCVPGKGLDVYGHGTAVASIVRAAAPEAEIGSFRGLDERNQSRSAIIAECAELAIERGYHIINCSFGCRGDSKFILKFKEWCDRAYLKGIHIVAACNNRHHTIPEWPSHFASVIGANMAATESPEIFYRRDNMIELAARGERLRVPWKGGGFRIETGSSFAAPHIAGMLARLLSECPEIDPLTVKPLLHQIAVPWMSDLKVVERLERPPQLNDRNPTQESGAMA